MHSDATRIIVGRDVAVAEWVRRRIPDGIDAWGPCRAIGIARGNELIAGIVYNNFRWPSIEASIASIEPGWCSRRNLAAAFAFPFRQLGVRRVGASTAAANAEVRRFLLRLGFRQEGVMRQALKSGDAVIFGMLEPECRWLTPSAEFGDASAVEGG
jgi:RimJ/RimL family protein N-acetyltransferase